MDLGRATWREVEATATAAAGEAAGETAAAAAGEALLLLALPLGSLEQHGPHLPLDTDTRIAEAVARGLAARRPGVVVAPPVAYGASGEHAAFPGTLLVGHDVLAAMLVELVRSARGTFGGVVLVNAHGGNEASLADVARRCAGEGDDVLAWRAAVPGGDAHAGRTETSLLLAVDASLVRVELAEPGCTEPIDRLLPRLRTEGVRPVSSNGVLGDPTGASVEEGRALFDALVADLVASVTTRWPAS